MTDVPKTTAPAAPMNRETWLNQLAEHMAPRFAELGAPLPPFRVSVGFTSHGGVANIGGECWNKSRSEDGRFEILIAPHQADPMQVAAILAHELTHAAAGFEHGHRGNFAKHVAALGLVRPFTSSVPGPVFKEWAQPFLDALGPLPHARLMFDRPAPAPKPRDPGADDGEAIEPAGDAGETEERGSTRPKKQGTRLKKAECAECGYAVRVTKKWLELGPPGCPNHGAMSIADDEAA